MNANAVLTRREADVAEMIAWGAAKKEIADQFFISERTVENTARHIYEKTMVTKANELSAWWFCTHFNIPFDLSPMKRRIGALAFLTLIVSSEVATGISVYRLKTAKTIASRIKANRAKTGKQDAHFFDFLPFID